MKLNKLTVKGYKSIQSLEAFELRDLNVLIGANGAGKSNFISLFRLLSAILAQPYPQALQNYVLQQGGVDTFLFGGRKQTAESIIELTFTDKCFSFKLTPTANNTFNLFGVDTLFFKELSEFLPRTLKDWRVYHFHDTSENARVKQLHPSNDNLLLKPDAANLAAYIAYLKRFSPDSYLYIVETIRLAAPFFGDFVVRDPLPKDIELEWFDITDPDTPLRAHFLSDGTLRFICLAVLLLQPVERMPDIILIDEPELGLHPYAINLVAGMIQRVAEFKQVIISTQSVELLNQFEPADVIVTERVDGASTFKRLDETDLADWLDDYTLGDLWKRNILGGRPSR